MLKDDADNTALNSIKGRNPHFFADPNIDRLLSMLMELASEMSVMRDRLDTHERLAATKGIYTEDDIETFRPNDDEAKAREEWRGKFLDRILKALCAEYDNKTSTNP